jgi:hypothetical protein
MEDRLSRALAHVDKHAVVLEAYVAGRLGYEGEHLLRLLGLEFADLAEAGNVPLGKDQQVRLGFRIDVLDGDEAVALANVLTLSVEAAEKAVVRQPGSPPP